ncbi:putative C-terminal motor kinesin [Trypanosoma rangeli]|uniref:Putative C-terminal motor kinesin n=1 Tax=Trypanosoma rangeli TaxID=5698 RepID=A0A3R7N503_TRYRA|nr:putative C-terminal motor kinesin [Trypanosoma rangeli]RNE96577.1 putative C-terminal motor kinesin [Trypanosoma rangeli]|eukprot:RNE96577.1 putative C-terminal motor kinesin [Trypanosoma rangeli]
MGTTMCVPLRRREESLLSYFGVPVNALTVYEQRVVQQSTSYIPGIPVLLQDIAFYWDSRVEGDAGGGTTAAVSPDSIWIATVEKTINEFARKCKFFSLRKNTHVRKNGGDAKKKSSGKYTSRVFNKPLQALMGKRPLCAPHFVAILTLFLRKLPEPLLTSLYVRKMEDILSNKNLTEDEKAQALQKASRQTFMSTHPTENAVYQYLKQLVQRHRAELIAAEVEMLAHSMARESTEQVTEFVLQQLRPVVGSVLPTQKRGGLIGNKPELNVSSGVTPEASVDVASGTEEAPYSPPGSPHSEAVRGAHTSTHGTSAGSLESASARATCSDKMEIDGDKKNEADGNPLAEGETGQGSAIRYADSTNSSSSSMAEEKDEETKTSVSRGGGIPAASKEASVGISQETNSGNSAGKLVAPKERHGQPALIAEEEQWDSAGTRNVETTPHNKVLVVDSVQATNTSGVVSRREAREQPSSVEQKRQNTSINDASGDVAGSGSDVKNKTTVNVFSSPCDVAKLEEKAVKWKQTSPPCKFSSSNHSPLNLSRAVSSPLHGGEVGGVNGAEKQEKELQQQQLVPRGISSCVGTQSPRAQPLGSLAAASPLIASRDLSPIASGGKLPHIGVSRSLAEQHPRSAALLGAKQLFLGKQILPAKQVQLELSSSLSLIDSVDAKAKGPDSEFRSTRQASKHTTEVLNGVCGQPLSHDERKSFFSYDDTDKLFRVHDESLIQKVIQPLEAKLDQLTARCTSFEQLLKTLGTLEPPHQSPQFREQVVGEVRLLKDVVRQLVESHSENVEDIQNLQKQLEQQTQRLACNKDEVQGWHGEALSAKEMALEAQLRCADLQKTQIQNHQTCQYMSLKLRELASKLEHGEKDCLDLRVEVSALQRQAVQMREKLLTTF